MSIGAVARIIGRQDERIWDCAGVVVESEPKRVVIRTHTTTEHWVEVTPRHVGVELGDPGPLDKPGTICNITMDGRLVGLATYYEYPKGILVVPRDYSPAWVYSASAWEEEQHAEAIAEVRRELGAGSDLQT